MGEGYVAQIRQPVSESWGETTGPFENEESGRFFAFQILDCLRKFPTSTHNSVLTISTNTACFALFNNKEKK